jgi:hypothetical protein
MYTVVHMRWIYTSHVHEGHDLGIHGALISHVLEDGVRGRWVACIGMCAHIHHLHGICENTCHRCGDPSSPHVRYERRLLVCDATVRVCATIFFDSFFETQERKKGNMLCDVLTWPAYLRLFYAWFHLDHLSKTWFLSSSSPSVSSRAYLFVVQWVKFRAHTESKHKQIGSRAKKVIMKNLGYAWQCTWGSMYV